MTRSIVSVLSFLAVFALAGCGSSDGGVAKDVVEASDPGSDADACTPVEGSSADCLCTCPGAKDPTGWSTPACEGESSTDTLARCDAECLARCPALDAIDPDAADSPATADADAGCTLQEGASADCMCTCPGSAEMTGYSVQPCVGESSNEAIDRCVDACLTHCPAVDVPVTPDVLEDTAEDAHQDVAADAPADAPDAPVEPSPSGPLVPWVGHVLIDEAFVPGGGPYGSSVDVRFQDAPDPIVHDLISTSGDCRYYRSHPPAACVPTCLPNTEYCTHDGHCQAWAKRLSAGVVTVTGGKATLTATPDDNAWYSVAPEPADLFGAGDDLVVKAAGGDVAAFDVLVKGVADMEPSWSGELAMKDGEALHVPWVVKNDGATVEVVLQIGWHGNPPTDIIWCEAADAQGSIDIPAEFVSMFPPWGGMGLFQNPSWARRMMRTVVDTAAGPIEVRASSRTGVYYVH